MLIDIAWCPPSPESVGTRGARPKKIEIPGTRRRRAASLTGTAASALAGAIPASLAYLADASTHLALRS